MNWLIKLIKESKTILFFRILSETFRQAFINTKYIANGNRHSSPAKLESDLLIRLHAIEKGMSIGNARVGFGKIKVSSIIDDLRIYLSIGGRKQFVNEAASIIREYISFNCQLGADMSDIESAYKGFISAYEIECTSSGGILNLSFEKDIQPALDAPFSIFSQSRFSIRDFGKTAIDPSQIHKALKISERTPSACNRQSWRLHLFEGDQKNKICELQGGCNGFYKDIQYALLVCGDQRYYNINELHQVYVDGGLYSMNLLYALHAQGLATIPLTMGHKIKKNKRICKCFNIPNYEMPVLLIGIGSYKSNFRVAASYRKNYNEYLYS